MSAHVSQSLPLSAGTPRLTLRLGGESICVPEINAEPQRSPRKRGEWFAIVLFGLKRRWVRERRRRKVGRAYDMALEIARMIPPNADVLDVGCGNGFIAHHLSALVSANVLGIDLQNTTEAPIDYVRYDGARFPANANSVDAVLLCYVLHHAQDVRMMLSEVRRVLRDDGLAIIYEDIPATWWDRVVCSIHNRQWADRTGACTFRQESAWRSLFAKFSFEIVKERQLARMRNLTHPVRRRLYVLRVASASGSKRRKSSAYHGAQVEICSRSTLLEL